MSPAIQNISVFCQSCDSEAAISVLDDATHDEIDEVIEALGWLVSKDRMRIFCADCRDNPEAEEISPVEKDHAMTQVMTLAALAGEIRNQAKKLGRTKKYKPAFDMVLLGIQNGINSLIISYQLDPLIVKQKMKDLRERNFSGAKSKKAEEAKDEIG